MTEAIQRAEKDFALDLHLLVDETLRDAKTLNAISAIETGRIENIFYPYQPHRRYLTTRFGLLFYNDKLIIPEAMTTLTQQQIRWTRRQRHYGGHECIERHKKNRKTALAAEPQVRTLKHIYLARKSID